MLKLNTPYLADEKEIVFQQNNDGTIKSTYSDGTIEGKMEGNTLKAVFHNPKVNVSGIMEITFHETGFTGKWKKGMEPGLMKGKWNGEIQQGNQLTISIPNEIKELLKSKVINPSCGIDRIYQAFDAYFKEQYDFPNNKHDTDDYQLYKFDLVNDFSFVKELNVRSIGIDFPIKLSKGKNRPVLMICAMDPLRTDNEQKLPEDKLTDWVPFSVIKNPAKEKKYSENENLQFFYSLLDDFDLYLTDIYKLFYRDGTKISNKIKTYTDLPIHREILESEINCIKPTAILTLGNGARNAICELYKIYPPTWNTEIFKTNLDNGCSLVMIPHISGAANGSKAPILNNPKYAFVRGVNNGKYANIILKTLLPS
jgi:hypothetical protein